LPTLQTVPLGVKALRLGEASVVGNMEYFKQIYAAILGYGLFGEIPDVYTLIGASIIIGLHLSARGDEETNDR
jgi:drug/metabolite transporter (DMT)-like permease